MPCILGADLGGVLKWYVDASFAVHSNMQGHTTMGSGFPIISLTKQKLNTRSSMESKIVGVDDMIHSYSGPYTSWKNKDTRSQIRLSSKITRAQCYLKGMERHNKHINVRYFLITDQIAKGEVQVEWCLTKDMIGNFMTKPLQGSLFRKFGDLIMGALSIEEAQKIMTCDPMMVTDHESLVHR